MNEHKSRPKQATRKKIGGSQEEFDLSIEPIPVHIRRTRWERFVDAVILIAIAVAAQVVTKLFFF